MCIIYFFNSREVAGRITLQNHVCTNQLKRQDEELKKQREEKEKLLEKGKSAEHDRKDDQTKLMEVESKVRSFVLGW